MTPAEPQRQAETELILRRRNRAAAGAPDPLTVDTGLQAAELETPRLQAARLVHADRAPAGEGAAPPSVDEAAAPPPAEDAAPPPAAPPGETWGLALSGGGIRSATVSLGVLQAIAAAPAAVPAAPAGDAPGSLFASSLLSRFDYLSTVSGGGYAGAFLCSLFLPGRLRPATAAEARPADASALAADDAVRVLRADPPGRRVGDGHYDALRLHEAPLAWLRDNGRYLAPTGGGDMLYAGSLALRNWLAVHYVLGTLLLGLFSALAALSVRMHPLRLLDAENLALALAGTTWVEQLWWSPTLLLPLAVFLAWAVPAGIAYWIPAPAGPAGRCGVVNRVFGGYVLVVAVFVAVWAGGLAPDDARLALWRDGTLLIVLALGFYVTNRAFSDAVEVLRVRLTRQLRTGLMVTGALLALALVDTAGHSIYLALVGDSARPAHALAPAGVVSAAVWAVRRFAKAGEGRNPPAWLGRLPWTVLGGVAGIALLALIASGWAAFVVWLEWQGAVPAPAEVRDGDHAGMLLWLSLVMLSLAALTGQFPSFINLSSLQSFYAARITRAWLGASNGARFATQPDRRKTSVAEPELQDSVTLADFLVSGVPEPGLSTLAPLHLVNLTMNNTVDPGEQLVQRDRKGEAMLVTPLGFFVSGQYHPFPAQQSRFEIQRTLTVGQWIGTSGAAFSTGIGRQTSLGLSLLFGAANMRLGTWWESGAGADPGRPWPLQLLHDAFRTQGYLVQEFSARFHGLRRQWQYLSDGGHFENTGLYELLRPGRGLRFAIACDNGADRDYRFADLGNLIRLVRIDLGIELEVDAGVREHPVLREWIGTPEDFRAAAAGAPPAPAGAAPAREPVALLLRARRGGSDRPHCWVLMLKPRVRRDAAADIVQYRALHPSFPQEPVADQSFDEAQWESYRKLGHDSAAALLAEPVWSALHAWIAAESLPLAV